MQTIIWKYDSNDWRVGFNNVTTATVDASYNLLINNATEGTFDSEGAIMLTHELNNYTMQEAINFYPQLQSAFKVRHIASHHITDSDFLSSFPLALAYGSCWGRAQQDAPIPGDELYPADVRAVYVSTAWSCMPFWQGRLIHNLFILNRYIWPDYDS